MFADLDRELKYAFGSFAHFLERIGGAAGEIFGFFTGAPPLPMIDQQTGKPLPLPSPEEIKAERRRRLMNWFVGSIILYLGYRTVKYLLSRMRKAKSPTQLMLDRQWDQQINKHGGEIGSQMSMERPYVPMRGEMGNGLYGHSPYNNNLSGINSHGSRTAGGYNRSDNMYNNLDDIFG